MFEEFTSKAFLLAKQIAPKDSLNLVLHAMTLRQVDSGGKVIHYSGAVAPYLDALEDGTKRFDGHKDFIENKTYDSIVALASSVFNGTFNEDVFDTTLQQTKDLKPNERTNIRYLQSIGGVSLVSEWIARLFYN